MSEATTDARVDELDLRLDRLDESLKQISVRLGRVIEQLEEELAADEAAEN
jgi:hypothetical protein